MTRFTNRMTAVLMVLCLLVSLVIPVAADPSATVIVTAPTGYTCASDVVYNTTGGIIANWGARAETSTFLSSYAESFYTTGYTYEELSALSGGTTSTAPSSALYTALQKLMTDNHTFYTAYSGSGAADSRQLYKYTDCVSGDTSKVSLLYQGTMVSSTWDSGKTYNQEHMWPNSKCIGTDETDVGDIMHLRPAYPNENSARGNDAYGESTGYYDPGVSVRGDCARTILYMYTRWGNTGNMWGTSGAIESLDVLLKWMEEDPVDTWEMGHNDAVQSITGTRNVFVDYPELAFLLFNQTVPSTMVTPSGSTGSTVSHTHNYIPVTTAPTCTAQGYTTYSCACGYRYINNYTDAPGHSYSGGSCIVCGASDGTGGTTGGNVWTKVELSQISAADTVAITMTKGDTTWALYNANGTSKAPTGVVVTVSGTAMTCEDNETISWNIASDANGLVIYVAGSTSKWLYSTATNNGTRVGTNTNKYWTVDASSGYLKHLGTNRYLGVYTTNPDWRCYTNTTGNTANQTLSFWKLNAACSHSYTSSVTTAPTCTADGIRTYTCGLCGDSYTESIDATGHSYVGVVTPPTCTEDGYTTHTCSNCGDEYVDTIVPATGFTLAGANTVLGGVLDMNFFINPADLNGTDYYAEITLYAEDGTVTTTIPYADWEVRPDYLVVTQKGLAARQMADKMEVVIYNGDGTQASDLWTDSIRGYAMRILEDQSDECKTLIVDMLNYGAAAQTFFGYNTDDLANSQLSETQQGYATQSVTCTDQRVQGEGYYGSTLTLKDQIMLSVYFNNITPDMYAVVSFTDHKGTAHETRVEGSAFSQYNSSVYGVVVDELVVADGDRLVTVTVYDAEGNVVASAIDTVNSYAARQMGGDPLYEMVAKFTTAAYAYFH